MRMARSICVFIVCFALIIGAYSQDQSTISSSALEGSEICSVYLPLSLQCLLKLENNVALNFQQLIIFSDTISPYEAWRIASYEGKIQRSQIKGSSATDQGFGFEIHDNALDYMKSNNKIKHFTSLNIVTCILLLILAISKEIEQFIFAWFRQHQLTNQTKKNKQNCTSLILLPLLAFFLYNGFFDTAADNYYFKSSGNDDNSQNPCTFYNVPCKSLSAISSGGILNTQQFTAFIINSVIHTTSLTTQQSTDSVMFTNKDGQITSSAAEISLQGDGKFSITSGTLKFINIIFTISSNAVSGYIITGTSGSTGIIITNCLMQIASESTIQTGLVNVIGGTLTITNLIVEDITIQSYSIIKVNEGAGQVEISDSTFENISKTGDNGKGSVIEGELIDTTGKITVSSSTFTSCKVDTSTGLGGAIYLNISNNTNKFNFTGIEYSVCDAKYGKSLFINATDLKQAIQGSTDGNILGLVCESGEQQDLIQIMGYDNDDLSVAIPLIYVYTSVVSSVYHVKYIQNNDKGIDNRFCGHLSWPCETIIYAISRSGSATEKKVGIITGYQMKETLSHSTSSLNILIQNSLDSNGQSTTISSILMIGIAGKFTISGGTLSFNYTTLQIDNAGTGDYIITGSTVSTKISIENCTMTMTSGLTITRGFIELNDGTLSISKSLVNNVNISGQSVIKVNNGAGNVIISGSTFSNIQQSGIGNGSVINAQLQFGSLLTIKDSSSFMNCISETAGGAIQTVISGGELKLNGISFESCNSINGGGIYSTISGRGKLTITNQCQFISCSSTAGSGGAIFASLEDESTLYIDDIIFDGCTCTQPGNGGALSIHQQFSTSKISISDSSFKDCKTIANSADIYGWGGAIYLYTQVSSNDLTLSNFMMTELDFTGCASTKNVGDNIHIRSINTPETGLAIAYYTMLTVNDTIDLYTSGNYNSSYMGINNSIEVNNPGTNSLDYHDPLFISDYLLNFKNPTSGSGGVLSAQIKDGELNIATSTFDTCNCSQPYSGGALSLTQESTSSKIIITDCTFKDCKTIANSADIYGWGGAIYLYTQVSSNDLTLSNFMMTEL
ncbi:MAG: hypothetical protein EZS28_007792, partial [Streblomastix strix]